MPRYRSHCFHPTSPRHPATQHFHSAAHTHQRADRRNSPCSHTAHSPCSFNRLYQSDRHHSPRTHRVTNKPSPFTRSAIVIHQVRPTNPSQSISISQFHAFDQIRLRRPTRLHLLLDRIRFCSLRAPVPTIAVPSHGGPCRSAHAENST
jgi:hypothetical protein